ncbi:MAG: dethiobiotin synthase [Rickettsiales endosymbiont of Dermacentor nuttalli]
MQIIAIVSPGTNAGKTLVTTSYAYQLKNKGNVVRVVKPIITGWQEDNNDTIEILRSLDLPITHDNIEKTSPCRLVAPLSPDIAALKENKDISLGEIIKFCYNNGNENIEYLIVETAGGILTPINKKETMLDLVIKMDAEIILVTNHYLGSISHTIMAYNIIKSYNLRLKRLIINQNEKNGLVLSDTIKTLRNFIKLSIIEIPFITQYEEKWKYTKDLAEI